MGTTLRNVVTCVTHGTASTSALVPRAKRTARLTGLVVRVVRVHCGLCTFSGKSEPGRGKRTRRAFGDVSRRRAGRNRGAFAGRSILSGLRRGLREPAGDADGRTEKNINILDDAPLDATTHAFAVELVIDDEADGDLVRELWETAPDKGDYGVPYAMVLCKDGRTGTAALRASLDGSTSRRRTAGSSGRRRRWRRTC